MSVQKTRIWHGGLSQLGVSADLLPEAGVPQPVPSVAPADDVQPEAAIFEQAASTLVPTRFFPIDSLLPPTEPATVPREAADAAPEPASDRHVDTHPTLRLARHLAQLRGKWPGLRALPTRRFALYAALVCCALALLAWPAPPAPAGRVAAASAPQAPPAQRLPRSDQPLSAPVLPSTASGLERAAVDALVAGDYVAAQVRYRQLTQAVPDNRAFAEAQRILTLRVQGVP